MAENIAAPQNGVTAFADALSKILPLFLGSGTTSKSETVGGSSTSSLPPEIATLLSGMLNTSMQGANSTSASDNVVSNILQRAQQAFAPVLASQKQSGIYNSSTVKQLASEAVARATGEASGAVLQKQTADAKNATDIAQVLANNSKVVTSTQSGTTTAKTAPVIPGGKNIAAGGLALGALKSFASSKLGNTAMDKLKELASGSADDPLTEAGRIVYDNLFGGSTLAKDIFTANSMGATNATAELLNGGFTNTVNMMDPSQQLIASLGFNAPDAVSLASMSGDALGSAVDSGISSLAPDLVGDAASLVGDYAGSLVGDVAYSTAGDVIAGGINDMAIDELGSLGTDAAGSLITDGALDIGFPYYTAVKVGAKELGINEITGVTDAIDSGVGSVVDGATSALESVGQAVGGGSVICTELLRQDKLEARDYYLSSSHFSSLPATVIDGYHFWAKPYVKLMRGKHGAFWTARALPWAQGRTDYLNCKWNFRGWFTVAIGERVCNIIGKLRAFLQRKRLQARSV